MVHGNGERASTTVPCRDEHARERALGPVVHVAGRVAERAPVRAAGHVQPAPQRLARHRDQQAPLATRAISATVASGSGTCSSTSIAVASVELVVGEGQRAWPPRRGTPGSARWRLSHSACQLGVVEVDADDPPVAQALGPLVGEHALAAADVEHRRRRGLRPTARRASPWKRAISRRTTGLVEPYLSKVLPVGTVPGSVDPGVATPELTAARAARACRSAVPESAPVRARVAGLGGLVVRGLHAQRAAPRAARARACAAAATRLRGQDVADHAERHEAARR